MGGAVAEFLPGPLCYFVREQAFGLLPGLPNLYCLDAGFHLLWVAEWPTEAGLCTALCGVENGELIATAGSGAQVRIEAATGRLLRVASTLAVAG